MKKFKITYKITEDDSDHMSSETITDFSTVITATSWGDLKEKTIQTITSEDGNIVNSIIDDMNFEYDQSKFESIFFNENDYYLFSEKLPDH